jgi:hypothetical protein
MNAHCGDARGAASGSKWGYLIAGAIALNAAAVVQFALGDLSEGARAKLPGVVFKLHAAGGKVPLTVPIALLGAGLIVYALLPNRQPELPAPPVGRLSSAANRVPPRVRLPMPTPAGLEAVAAEPGADEERLPIGEELPDQEQPRPRRKKIPALPGRFDGRASSERAETGGPAPAESERPRSKTKSGGNVELASEKYLDKRKKPGRNSHQG